MHVALSLICGTRELELVFNEVEYYQYRCKNIIRIAIKKACYSSAERGLVMVGCDVHIMNMLEPGLPNLVGFVHDYR